MGSPLFVSSQNHSYQNTKDLVQNKNRISNYLMMFLSFDGFTTAPLISKSLVSLLPKQMEKVWFKIFNQTKIHLMISLSIVGLTAASASPLSILLVLYLPKYSTSSYPSIFYSQLEASSCVCMCLPLNHFYGFHGVRPRIVNRGREYLKIGVNQTTNFQFHLFVVLLSPHVCT